MVDRAGKTYRLNEKAADPAQGQVVEGALFEVEGRWKDLTGMSWRDSNGNFAAAHYGFRAGMNLLPADDDVWYGKIETTPGGARLGHLVHESEIGEEVV